MLFCLGLCAYKLFFYFDKKSENSACIANSNITRLSADEMATLQEGDFILRRGFGFFSDYISTTLNSGPVDVTHAGIIVKRNGALHVIHSLSSDVDGMQIQTLEEFLKYSAPGKIIVTSAKGGDFSTGHKIAVHAENYLKKKIPFDHNGKYDNDNEFFCTELIWKILEKDLKLVSLPSVPEERKKFFYSMEPMYNSQYFDIKINQYK